MTTTLRDVLKELIANGKGEWPLNDGAETWDAHNLLAEAEVEAPEMLDMPAYFNGRSILREGRDGVWESEAWYVLRDPDPVIEAGGSDGDEESWDEADFQRSTDYTEALARRDDD